MVFGLKRGLMEERHRKTAPSMYQVPGELSIDRWMDGRMDGWMDELESKGNGLSLQKSKK